jgi:hypothetical protein
MGKVTASVSPPDMARLRASSQRLGLGGRVDGFFARRRRGGHRAGDGRTRRRHRPHVFSSLLRPAATLHVRLVPEGFCPFSRALPDKQQHLRS